MAQILRVFQTNESSTNNLNSLWLNLTSITSRASFFLLPFPFLLLSPLKIKTTCRLAWSGIETCALFVQILTKIKFAPALFAALPEQEEDHWLAFATVFLSSASGRNWANHVELSLQAEESISVSILVSTIWELAVLEGCAAFHSSECRSNLLLEALQQALGAGQSYKEAF